MPTEFNIQKVLVAPLDWGLGHATRCIPIIKALMQNGYEVLIATDGVQKILLQKEFPQLQFLALKGYNVSYSKRKWLLPFKLLMQVPEIVATIKNENLWLDKIIDEHQINIVISDNRFGLYSPKAKCIFITHQLTIKAPFNLLQQLLQKINYSFINRFASCWIPDVAGEQNVAGILSHPLLLPKIPVHYVGLLSRFEKENDVEKKYDYCIVLSGPEPQRTILEKLVLNNIDQLEGDVLLVRGMPGNNEVLSLPSNVLVKNHLSGNELQQALQQSETIISRSGYTTVMEILALQEKSILIPTPGQTEQEYLAERLMNQQWCFAIKQSTFDLIDCTKKAKKFSYKQATLSLFNKEKLQQILL